MSEEEEDIISIDEEDQDEAEEIVVGEAERLILQQGNREPIVFVRRSQAFNADLQPPQSDEMNNAQNNDAPSTPPGFPLIADTQDEIRPLNTRKKRKRNRISSGSDDESPEGKKGNDSDDDDGRTCAICLDVWRTEGDHRIVCLKCGHLFGDSCIRRWLRENPSGQKSCPQCKTKAKLSDIRYLYVKRVQVVDNTEEQMLRKQLNDERLKLQKMQTELYMTRAQLKAHEKLVVDLQAKVTQAQSIAPSQLASSRPDRRGHFKLFMEKNIEISRDGGCRVITFSAKQKLLLCTQKSTVALFPGQGIRFIDLPTFRLSQFMPTSATQLRDLALDATEEIFSLANGDKIVKYYNVHNRQLIDNINPEYPCWANAFDPIRQKILYLGMQKGMCYTYDIRQPRNPVEEHLMPSDHTPVLRVCPIEPTEAIPYGGFLVCKLMSCWFFEYNEHYSIRAHRLNVDGPFYSLDYNSKTHHVLISNRPGARYDYAQHTLCDLVKLDEDMIGIQPIYVFKGSKVVSMMTRSTQINVGDYSIVAAYREDNRAVDCWNVHHDGSPMKSLSVDGRIMDMCGVNLNNEVYLTALGESRCRVFKVIDDNFA